MITFIVSIILLFLGYFIYGKIVEKIFGADPNRTTPAYRLRDNVDYMPMNTFKAYMIEFLDIAGLGPVFGAILGAAYGPVAFPWIVLGGIFGGAVHDYFSGMMSVRQNGESIAEVVGKWMGLSAKQIMRIFTVFFMILVGAAFMMGPAKILTEMVFKIKGAQQFFQNFSLFGFTITITKQNLVWIWVIIIFAYYFLATLLPIDKIIGRFYPIFGLALLFMALGIGATLIIHGHNIPELTFKSLFTNMKPNAEHYPIFPLIFITISCGAISGFHSTQAPLMARTIKNEKHGRFVFYGAMLTETFVALIWAAAAMTFFNGVAGLNHFLTVENGNPAKFVADISSSWLGKIGGFLAILGVIAAPITTGDTALRSARLIVSDFTKLKQSKIGNRLIITIPIFITAFLLLLIKFDALWRLMFWFNQILATIVLWTISVYLAKKHKFYWVSLIPAIFMTAVIFTYPLIAPEVLQPFFINKVFGSLSPETALIKTKILAYSIGLSITAIITIIFFVFQRKYAKQKPVID